MKKAAELSMISGMRQEISFHALRLFHDNPDRAMSWMLDDGQEWVRMLDDPKYKESERLANEKAEALAVEREKQTDEAALDDLGAVELLSTTATPLTATDQHSPFSTGQPTGGDPIDSPAVVTHRSSLTASFVCVCNRFSRVSVFAQECNGPR